MLGFEIVGVILAIWPMVKTAVALHKARKNGRENDLLLHQLDTEELIFRESVHRLLASDVSEAELIQLSDSNRPNVDLWKNEALQSNLKRRLGHDKSKTVLKTLEEMGGLLESLREKLDSNNVE